MTIEPVDVRLARLDQRLKTVEREIGELKEDLRAATEEVTKATYEMKLLAVELRSAIASAMSKASKPFDELSAGWRIVAGVGTLAVTLVMVIGGIIGIVDHLTKH